MTYSNHRNRAPARSLLTSALVTCLMLGAAPSVMAQSATSSLRGQVAQAEAGTEVTATNLPVAPCAAPPPVPMAATR